MKHSALALTTIFGFACIGSDTDLETAFCEGLEQPAARTVMTTPTADDAPDITDIGRVDIQLPAAGLDSNGFVAYLPDEAGTFAFGLTEDVSIMLRDADGVAVPLDTTVTGSTLCDALAVRYSATLAIERHTIELGTTSAGTIGIIAEESDDDL